MKTLSSVRVLSLAFGVALAAAAFAVAPLADAQGLTQSQVDAITTLLQAFGADASTIANVQAALQGTNVPSTSDTGTASSTSASSGSVQGSISGCATLSGALSVGSQGEDVSKLQSFLAKDKSVYPQGLVTGYYGQDTEDAVRRYQATHNIVATGTPDTTGYGVVGPTTRGEMDKEMETECETGDSGSANSSDNASATSSTTHEGEGSSATATSSTSSGDN